MGFCFGKLAGAVSALSSINPAWAAFSATAGSLAGALSDDCGEVYYLSPFNDDLVPKPAGWNLWPKALTPAGYPGGKPATEGTSASFGLGPLGALGGTSLGRFSTAGQGGSKLVSGVPVAIERPLQRPMSTNRRSLEDAVAEHAAIRAMFDLERAGVDPAWGYWIFRGCTRVADWWKPTSSSQRRSTPGAFGNSCSVHDLAVDLGFDLGGASLLATSGARGARSSKVSDVRDLVSLSGPSIGQAAALFDQVLGVWPDLVESARRELEVQAAAAAQLEATMSAVLGQFYAAVESGAVNVLSNDPSELVRQLLSVAGMQLAFANAAPSLPPAELVPPGLELEPASPSSGSAPFFVLAAVVATLLVLLVARK